MTPAQGAAVIGEEARRLERLVQDLLELARVGRADFAVERDPVDLGAVVVAAVERHLPQRPGPGRVVVGRRHRRRCRRSAMPADCCRRPPTWSRTRCASPLPEGASMPPPPTGQISVSDTGPGLARGGAPPRIRALLPVRALPDRAPRRQRARAGDRCRVARRDGRRRLGDQPPPPAAPSSHSAVPADYAAIARSFRCAPTLRLTRCSALSTVLQSQSSRRPTSS